eukprot:TRINITY_DN2661_c0_g1_i3.p2 TRINITY_DN2661_c0_g1~~TRINITY_DN2661_c0_g1_i3.p2  ORF type:complete len:150 (+),score=30.54 TRINITY_DN2661_c0_g1_i3:400-849(+)
MLSDASADRATHASGQVQRALTEDRGAARVCEAPVRNAQGVRKWHAAAERCCSTCLRLCVRPLRLAAMVRAGRGNAPPPPRCQRTAGAKRLLTTACMERAAAPWGSGGSIAVNMQPGSAARGTANIPITRRRCVLQGLCQRHRHSVDSI